MKGNPKVIRALNELLAVEFAAYTLHFVHARMCAHWGYQRLARKLMEESTEEIRHAEALIDRILFLEGAPDVSRRPPVPLGSDVRKQLENALRLEADGVKAYNEAIQLCWQAADGGTRQVLEPILAESEDHVNWLESRLHVIKESGMERYLAEEIGE